MEQGDSRASKAAISCICGFFFFSFWHIGCIIAVGCNEFIKVFEVLYFPVIIRIDYSFS